MAFDPSAISASQLADLLEGRNMVLVDERKDGSLESTTSAVMIDASPARVEEVLADFDRYSEWVPQVTRSEVVAEKGKARDVALKLSFRFAVFSKSVDYVLRYTSKGPHAMAFERVSGDFETNHGRYDWAPIEKGKRTLFFYTFYVDLGSMGTMVKMALKSTPQLEMAIASSTAVVFARAVKDRAEK